MRKFTNWTEKVEDIFDLNIFVDTLLKENVSIEILGMDKPYDDIDLKANENLITKLNSHIEEEILKSNLDLLEKIKRNFYMYNSLDFIESNIESIKEKLK